jgi:hypothetical protein
MSMDEFSYLNTLVKKWNDKICACWSHTDSFVNHTCTWMTMLSMRVLLKRDSSPGLKLIASILHIFKLSRISYHISHKGPEAHVNLKRTQNNCFFFNYYYCLKYKSSTYIKIYHMNNVVQKFIYDYISNVRLPFICHSYIDILVCKKNEWKIC